MFLCKCHPDKGGIFYAFRQTEIFAKLASAAHFVRLRCFSTTNLSTCYVFVCYATTTLKFAHIYQFCKGFSLPENIKYTFRQTF